MPGARCGPVVSCEDVGGHAKPEKEAWRVLATCRAPEGPNPAGKASDGGASGTCATGPGCGGAAAGMAVGPGVVTVGAGC